MDCDTKTACSPPSAADPNGVFPKNLRYLRMNTPPRHSQRQLAKKLAVSRTTYANYENGRVAVPMWFVWAVSCYFGKTVEELAENDMERMQ